MNQLAIGQTIDLTIDALALGGRAIGRHEGCVVFVDRGLPGQTLQVKLTTVRKRFAEAELVKVLDAGTKTCAPFCSHFGICGGCTWQDLPYEAQLHWKERFVRDSIARIGGQREATVLPIIASPRQRNFRNKMEFAFATDEAGELHLGLRRRGSHAIVDVTECSLQTPLTQQIVNVARDLARQCGLLAWNDTTSAGFWRFLIIREPDAGSQCLVHCITSSHTQGENVVRAFAQKLMDAVPGITGFAHSIRNNAEQVAYGEETVFTLGETKLVERLGSLQLAYGPDAFFQTNTPATALLYAEAGRMAALTGREQVWDLYCGVGSIALWLAPSAAGMAGMEASAAAIHWANTNAEAAGCTVCRFETGDVRRLIDRRIPRPDMVIIDPPRAGLHPGVINMLRKKKPSRIVYVSCNPATLARDVGAFATDYELVEVRPVDLFPQTPHVEAVALLRRRKQAERPEAKA